jgi:ribosomal protein L32E
MSPAKTTKNTGGKPAGNSKSTGTSMAVKRTLRAKTPKFKRHASYRKARLDDRWKKPRGLHNKQRDSKSGSSPKVSDGYRTPQDVRGLHISGLEMVRVHSVEQLQGVDKTSQGVVVESVGARKQLMILRAAQEQGVRVLNHKPEQRIKLIEGKRAERQMALEKNRKAKEESKKKAEKAADKKPVASEVSEEEKKQQQEKVKEEVLTGKGA